MRTSTQEKTGSIQKKLPVTKWQSECNRFAARILRLFGYNVVKVTGAKDGLLHHIEVSKGTIEQPNMPEVKSL